MHPPEAGRRTGEEQSMRIIDSQIHLFAPGAEKIAQALLQVLVPPEQVIAEMDAAGVEKAYLVPGNSAANATCVEAARRWPERFRVMAILGLDKPETRSLMERWDASGFHGARLVFPPYRKTSWLRDGTADWFWPVADRLRLPIMMWAPQQIDEVGRIAERHPNIRFVIDHMNLFVEDKGDVVTKAVDALLPLARRANIAVKVSALPAHSHEPYPYRDMHPHVQRVVEAFGAERSFWGTDLSRRACTYQEAISMFTEHMPFLNERQLREIMGEAALRWIGW